MLVATAGHVDHGKTSLVRNLTGVDTDRLAEEKRRGLTIELGYAFCTFPSGHSVGFIDVPGHNRFINTMIAGVNGIDLALVVIAADDGPMPQTLEHLEILHLLGVTQFIGVITKADLVDQARLEEVERQTQELIPNAPICRVTNTTGNGLEALRGMMEGVSSSRSQRRDRALFRMFIDRVFSVPGAGMVVTGTALSGTVRAGDTLQLHAPSQADRLPVRVREVRAQGSEARRGLAGQRCALNIAGKQTINDAPRGSALCAQADAAPSLRLDARCRSLPGQSMPLKHLGVVKLYIGTRRISAKTYILDSALRDAEDAHDTQYVHLILKQSVLAYAGDRFILRSDDEQRNLCGGVVIDPVAPKPGKERSKRLGLIQALDGGRPRAALAEILCAQKRMVQASWFARVWNLSSPELSELVSGLAPESVVTVRHQGDALFVPKDLWSSHRDNLIGELNKWHDAHPNAEGVDAASLQQLLESEMPSSVFQSVLRQQIEQGRIWQAGSLFRSKEAGVSGSVSIAEEWPELLLLMKRHGYQLPLRSEIMSEFEIDDTQLEQRTRAALKRGDLIQVGEKRLALPTTISEIACAIRDYADQRGSISVIEAKALLGLGRGITIEILELLDALHITRRRGNGREMFDPQAIHRLSS